VETNMTSGSRLLRAVLPAGAVLLAIARLATAPHARVAGKSVNEHGRDHPGQSEIEAVRRMATAARRPVVPNDFSADIVGLQLALDP
jgi:hypothetical protein